VLIYHSHKSSSLVYKCLRRCSMFAPLRQLWREDEGQDIAEYAVMLAVILILVVGTVRLIGSNANNAFSAVASAIQ
jgi:Flp pilus assembly pilin Flp